MVLSLSVESGTLALVIISSITAAFSLSGLAQRFWSFFLGNLELEEALVRSIVTEKLPSLHRREQRSFTALDQHEQQKKAPRGRGGKTQSKLRAHQSHLAKFPDMIDE